jgi:hypothetical protein
MSTISPNVALNLPTPIQAARCGVPPAKLDSIVKAAAELFGTSVVAQLEEDPEIEESYYLLRMKVVHDVDDVAQLRVRWFELLRQLAPDHCHFIRLAVDYSP